MLQINNEWFNKIIVWWSQSSLSSFIIIFKKQRCKWRHNHEQLILSYRICKVYKNKWDLLTFIGYDAESPKRLNEFLKNIYSPLIQIPKEKLMFLGKYWFIKYRKIRSNNLLCINPYLKRVKLLKSNFWKNIHNHVHSVCTMSKEYTVERSCDN